MTRGKAIRVAIEAMQREIRRLSVDANLHEAYGLDSPTAVSASKKRAELRDAILILEQKSQNPMLF